MTNEQLLARLTPIFRDVFGDRTLALRSDMSSDDIEDWNSISHVTLVVEIESEFGVHFKSAEMERLRSVGHIIESIQAKMPVTAT